MKIGFLRCMGLVGALLCGFAWAEAPPEDWRTALMLKTRAAVSQAEAGLTPTNTPTTPVSDGSWQLYAKVYVDGKVIAVASALGASIDELAQHAGVQIAQQCSAEQLAKARLWLHVSAPRVNATMIEFQNRALPLVGDVTVVPELKPEQLQTTIAAQKDYLLRHLDRKHFGFYKVYSARLDRPQVKLRTTYTASALWTLLQLNQLNPDPEIEKVIQPITNFLLSMQVRSGPNKGAFHYSFDPITNEKRQRFVVGTVSKTIFTLLELYRLEKNPRHLAAAKAAGKWLLAHVKDDGSVTSEVLKRGSTQKWESVPKHSVLYSSETLSALSRLYTYTKQPRWRKAATRIASRLITQAKQQGMVLSDDYRPPNTISTSWLAMALLDYTAPENKLAIDPNTEEVVFAAAQQVRYRQIDFPKNHLDYGRYFDTWATSGNGWMNEVLIEVYRRCQLRARSDCGQYLSAIEHSTRWLIQNTYSEANSYHLPNPKRALGGSIRNSKVEAVRTDAVCHAANSLIGLAQIQRASAPK